MRGEGKWREDTGYMRGKPVNGQGTDCLRRKAMGAAQMKERREKKGT